MSSSGGLSLGTITAPSDSAGATLLSPGVAAALYVDENGTSRFVRAFQSGTGEPSGNRTVSTGQVAWDGAAATRLRTPNVFKRVGATASGDTALWTPAAGKKFRLMKFRIEITGNATIGGGAVLTALLRDATTSLEVGGAWSLPAAAGTTLIQVSTPWIDLGNGALSSAANNVLNVNLSLALTTGSLVTWVAGTEE